MAHNHTENHHHHHSHSDSFSIDELTVKLVKFLIDKVNGEKFIDSFDTFIKPLP